MSLPVVFKEDIEEMPHHELVETFMRLQRLALHLEELVEMQSQTLKLAESMLKQLGVQFD